MAPCDLITIRSPTPAHRRNAAPSVAGIGRVRGLSFESLTNLRDLLASPADAISPLKGRELVKQKVDRWVCMGGRYPEHLDPGVFGNFKPDPSSAVIA